MAAALPAEPEVELLAAAPVVAVLAAAPAVAAAAPAAVAALASNASAWPVIVFVSSCSNAGSERCCLPVYPLMPHVVHIARHSAWLPVVRVSTAARRRCASGSSGYSSSLRFKASSLFGGIVHAAASTRY